MVYGKRAKLNLIAVAALIVVLRREIPIDASSNPIALGSHANGLRDLYPAVLKNSYLAVIIEYPFVGRRGACDEK